MSFPARRLDYLKTTAKEHAAPYVTSIEQWGSRGPPEALEKMVWKRVLKEKQLMQSDAA